MITIKELARLCGCSVATVNRALNDKPDVSIATKKRVKKMAREQGYRPSAMARSLVRGSTNTIGLAVLDIHNPIFTQLISILSRETREKGYSLQIEIMDGTPPSEYGALERLASLKVDGIIHFPLNTGPDYMTYLNQLHIPLIHLCNWLDDSFPHVLVREKEAAALGTKHIINAGYEQLIYVSPPLRHRGGRNLYTLEERLKGVEENKGNLELQVLDRENYIEDVIAQIKSSPVRTAIFCSSDIYALEIVKALRQKNLTPPGDYGIMGFDNISFLEYVSPRLSTLAYPIGEIGRQSLNLLFDAIEKKTSNSVMLETALVKGETI